MFYKTRSFDLCVDIVRIVHWGFLCAVMGHVVILITPVHSTKIVILYKSTKYTLISQQSPLTFFVFLAVVDDGEGGGPGGDVAGDGGHHGLIHLSLVIAADQEHHVLTHQLI